MDTALCNFYAIAILNFDIIKIIINKSNIIISSWNVEGHLSDLARKGRGGTKQIVDEIKNIRADIFVLLEAHSNKSIKKLPSYREFLNMGYSVYDVEYDDDLDSRTDTYAHRLSMLFLCKYPISKIEIHKLGKLRNCFVAIVNVGSNKQLRVIGIHLDDRSEETRLEQAYDLTGIINSSSIPTVLLGDFNAMHGEDFWPSKLMQTKLSKTASNFIFPKLSKRVIEMAEGKTLKFIESNTDLTEADASHQATITPKNRNYKFLPSVPLIQIDHIFVSKGVKINKYLVTKDSGSDHRAIVADLTPTL